jgi:hypothetical protein
MRFTPHPYRVVAGLRRRGYALARAQYVDGFMFDLVFKGAKRTVGEVLSFATEASNWAPVENDAGHFLYGLSHVGVEGIAVVQPPTNGNQPAHKAYERVARWLETERVRVYQPDQLLEPQGRLPF